MGKRIFIGDSRKHVVVMMEERLSKSGYDVLSADTGPQVIKTLGVNNVPHVIVIEAGIEGMDPLKLCRDIKSEKRLRNVPFLLLKDGSVNEKPYKELGIVEFQTRPCELTDVLEKIRLLATYGTSKPREKKSGWGWKVFGLLLMLACFFLLMFFIFIPMFTGQGEQPVATDSRR